MSKVSPKLRFVSFKNTHQMELSISDVLNESRGITYGIVQPGAYDSGGVHMIRSQDYVNGWAPLESIFKVARPIDELYERSRVSKGDILITVVGANIGTLAIVPAELHNANISRSVARISINNTKANSSFVNFYFEKRIRKLAALNQVGGAQPVLNLKQLSNFTIALPPLPEQQKIASFLSAVDEKIRQLTRKKELLEQYKKRVMQQLFSGKLRFKDENGRPFPKWEEKRLGDEIEEFVKKSVVNDEYIVLTSSNQGLMRQSDYYGENRLTERCNVGFNVIPESYITYRSRSDNRRFKFNMNNTGMTGIVSVYYPVFFCRECDPRFIVTLLNFYQHRIGVYSVGTSQTVLSYNQLRRIKFNIPCKGEQQKIANYLSSLDAKIDGMDTQIAQTQMFKKGLLQQMFV